MSKPTIFFSHSSRDKEVMKRLKGFFVEKTGGTVEVFLSSDGQSIPLGRNWVYKVQEGLEEAALLVVFITPNSISSNWVYFEAGYSYSKGVRVIPTGFLGVDLSQLGPPLSLLQGFNISSADSLNNLIALTNEQFDHTHKPTFSDEEYTKIIGNTASTGTGALDELIHVLDDVDLSLNERDDGLRKDPSELIPEIAAFLKDSNVEYQGGEKFIDFRGVRISMSEGTSPKPLRITVDPFVLELALPILQKILDLVRTESAPPMDFNFKLAMGLDVIQEKHKITARLYDDPISLKRDGSVVFRGMGFDTGYYHRFLGRSGSERSNAYIRITPESKLDPDDAGELLRLLVKRGVVSRPDYGLEYGGDHYE